MRFAPCYTPLRHARVRNLLELHFLPRYLSTLPPRPSLKRPTPHPFQTEPCACTRPDRGACKGGSKYDTVSATTTAATEAPARPNGKGTGDSPLAVLLERSGLLAVVVCVHVDRERVSGRRRWAWVAVAASGENVPGTGLETLWREGSARCLTTWL